MIEKLNVLRQTYISMTVICLTFLAISLNLYHERFQITISYIESIEEDFKGNNQSILKGPELYKAARYASDLWNLSQNNKDTVTSKYLISLGNQVDSILHKSSELRTLYEQIQPYEDIVFGMSSSEMKDYFKEKDRKRFESISVAGIRIETNEILKYTPVIILSLYAYFLVHLFNLKLDPNSLDKIAFSPLYLDLLSRFLTISLLVILPLVLLAFNTFAIYLNLSIDNPSLFHYWLVASIIQLILLILISIKLSALRSIILENRE
ncbi:MAG: hypothetical protein Roseis2KO_32760 [Roseivirga sp.]